MSAEKSPKEELSLREIMMTLKRLVRYLLPRIGYFIIAGLLAATAGYFIAKRSKPTYQGVLLFLLSTESKGSTNGLSLLTSQLGIDMGGDNANNLFRGEVLLDYMNSYPVAKKVFFKQIPGQDSVFINYLVRHEKLDMKWREQPRVASLFPFPASEERISPLADSVLRDVYSKLIKNYIQLNKPSKGNSFYTAATTSTNEYIAAHMPVFLVEETAKLYVETQTRQSQNNVDMLKHESDSLGDVLTSSIRSVASNLDETFQLNPGYTSQRSGSQRTQVNITAVSAAYAEVLKNLEIAKMTLQKEKPLFQVIDQPVMPLKQIRESKIKKATTYGLITDFVLGIIFSIFFFRREAKDETRPNVFA